MATIFKRRTSDRWVAAWFDPASGKRPEKSTRTTDKRLAQRIAQQWENESLERAAGLVDTHALSLARQEARPLEQHLDDYVMFLNGKGTGFKQIDLVESRLNRVIELAKAGRIADLTPSAVMAAISSLRAGSGDDPGISAQTATHYVRTIKGFTRWLVKDRRAGADMLAPLTTFNAEADRRRIRRDLTPEEFERLIAVADHTPVVVVQRPERGPDKQLRMFPVRMHYPDRVWAYRIAAGTGFRASEVASLVPESFDLDPEHGTPTITVEAGYSKRRRKDVQPIARELADQLRPWLKNKPANVPVCRLPGGKAALLLRADLAAARAAWVAEARNPTERAKREGSDFLRYVDSAGRYADFHSLRGQYIGRVVQAGANLKEAMELARHSDPKLTMKTYARVRLNDLAAVLERLPTARPSAPSQGTGTYGPV